VRIVAGLNRLGPAAVFLPDGSRAVVPGHEALTGPLVSAAAVLGPPGSFEENAGRLCASLPYAGHWELAEVPDGISAAQALHLLRYQAAKSLSQ